jgi:KDO2-lipid IV(A) lauroyltransferase
MPDRNIPRVAEASFVHRAWNLTDLILADRLLHPGTYRRYGGRIPERDLDRFLAAQKRQQPLILLTAYYGPYDLLPAFLGLNGLRATMPYRPHPNRSYDRYRQRIRSRAGCELVPANEAASVLQDTLEAGGTIALVADHHTERKGVQTAFLGLPTQAMRSVGLLACRYGADIVVAGIRRRTEPFRFTFVVTDIIDHHAWTDLDDPVPYITERYLRALEELVLGDPAQYLWGHLRWGAGTLAFGAGDAT